MKKAKCQIMYMVSLYLLITTKATRRINKETFKLVINKRWKKYGVRNTSLSVSFCII
jgi:hypothetical protein